MRPLIPKGFFYDRFPTESTSAAEIHAREVESSKKVLEDEIIALETQAALVIKKHNNFFVPHFGLKAQQGIAKLYLRDESGKWKGVTGGAQANSIANEIMTYKSPAPSETKLTQVECVGLIMNMIKRYELSIQIATAQASLTTEDVKEFYKLEKRPTYQQMKSVLSTMTANIGTEIPGKAPRAQVSISNVLGWVAWQNKYRPADWILQQQGVQGLSYYPYTRRHSSGFTIVVPNVISFYERAFRSGKPQSYWQLFSGYRLGIYEPMAAGHYGRPSLGSKLGVVLFKVDPFTGAPVSKVMESDVVAIGEAGESPGTLLSKARAALFPEMYTLEAGVNYNVGDAKVRYAKELKAALTLWDGVMDKPKTPLVTVASQSANTSKLAIYIQPTGIEAAMSRLVKGRDFQRWFDEMLGTKSQLANNLPKKMFTSQITDAEWQTYQSRMNNAIDTLHTALTHPATPMLGIYTMVDKVGSSQSQLDAKSILGLVGWPTNQPSKLFEVYVNDKRDANVVMNTVFNYLNEESLMAPPEMYFAESIQAKLEFAHYIPPKNPNVQQGGQAPQAGKTYNYEIVQKVSRKLNLDDHKKVASIPGSKPAGMDGSHRRYFNSGKTIVSKASVGSSSTFLPEGTELIAVPDTISTYNLTRNSFGRLQPEERNLLLGGVAIMSILGIAYMGRR